MIDETYLKQWVGRSETAVDVVGPTPLAALAATLDREPPAGGSAALSTVPPLWHWLYFLPLAPQSNIGTDGHPKRGGFLPPISLPRRMWAGGRLQFHGDITPGMSLKRVSTITDLALKQGATGPLVFVVVRHEISTTQGLAITEEQDLVYREDAQPGQAAPARKPAPATAAWTREWLADPVLLFRYSALTFNGHRIHYDRSYAMEVEHYPGLVVHGPLIASLLLDLLERNLPGARVTAYRFRALSPLFDGMPFKVCGQPQAEGRTVHLWAQTMDGGLAMEAHAELAS